ncbi:hypothetical protein Tco_1271945 [Tanacetum coccineum]
MNGEKWVDTCGNTILDSLQVHHECRCAESAPMPIAMPAWPRRMEKGEGCEGGLVIYTSGRMNGGPTDSGFLECLSRALAHTLSSEGQPTHTASGEDDTTGKDRLAKMPQARSLVGLHQGSIGRKGSPDGGRARGGQCMHRYAISSLMDTAYRLSEQYLEISSIKLQNVSF